MHEDDLVHGTSEDAKELKRTESSLRESEENLRAVLNATDESIFLLHVDGTLITLNDVAAERMGVSREELIGNKPLDLLPPEVVERRRPYIERVLTTGEHVSFEDERDGRCMVSHMHPILDSKGIVVRLAVYSRDITESKRAEEEKERLEIQNRQLQKSESLGRMAGAIAHHFNNQLMVVMGNLELALSKLPAATGLFECLSDAIEATRNASAVSSLMLTYLGQTPSKLEPIDFSEVCGRSLPILEAVMPKNIIIDSHFPRPGPVVRADGNQIQQVLANILTNAWEAMMAGPGVVQLTVKIVSPAHISEKHRFPVNAQIGSIEYTCLEVSDTGCGIAATDIDNIFDPFFSSKFTGRGLGLPVALGIVRAHEGIITVESIFGHGSIFRVYLPQISEENMHPLKKATQDPANQGGGTVLLVEDDERVRKLTEKMLASLGMMVLVAEDGVAALEMFEEHREEICCVLCDLTMPNMDGWATLTALRQLAPSIPVILASGYSEEYVMAGEHPEMPQACLSKPYRREQLQAAIVRARSANKSP